MKGKLKFFGAALTLGVFVCTAIGLTANKNMVPVSATSFCVEVTGRKPIRNHIAKSSANTDVWMDGSSSTGVTFNSSTGKINISAGGYIQTLSCLNGIFNVYADITSGSLDLFYSYEQPSALENPEYTAYTTLTSANTYKRFSDFKPTYVRFVAKTATTLNTIHIDYDGSGDVDDYYESVDYGMENYYIDPNVINKYANTCYATSREDTYRASKRSLKLTFDNTTENYVVLNTQREADANIIQCNPNLTNAVMTFKAKFSSNVTNHDMKVKVVGTDWTSSYWLPTVCTSSEESGWYEYSLDFSQYQIANSNSIIRINIRPEGITSSNKSTASVCLDEIDVRQVLKNDRSYYEETTDGLENFRHDKGWENTNSIYANDETFGPNSKNSILVTPKAGESINNNMKWCTVFNIANRFVDLSKGILSFNYKPFNVANPETAYVGVVKDWDHSSYKTVEGTYIKDGWYAASLDLSTCNLTAGNFFRLGIGFNIASTNLGTAYYYLDNVLVNEVSTENYTQGWENMPRDIAWEKCTATYDKSKVASTTSINSLKMTFEGQVSDTVNKVGCVLSPEALDNYKQIDLSSGILTAKFLFRGTTDQKVRLIIIDQKWKAARYDLNTTDVYNGWRQFSVNLANMSAPAQFDSGYTNKNVIRIGFGFNISAANMNSAIVWMDDVTLSKDNAYAPTAATTGTLWTALDSENVLQEEAIPSGRQLTSSNPLQVESVKNSVESMNLQLRAKQDLQEVNFFPATLTNENGNRLSAECFETLWAKYVYCGDGTNEIGKEGYKGKGHYPDALVPMQNIIEADENRISKNCNQTIWINVHIPKDAKAGTYTGNAKIIFSGAEYKVPMKVKIYNVTLSDKLNSRSMFGCWRDQIEKGMGTDHFYAEVRNNYYKFAEDHRINIGSYRENDFEVYENDKSTFAEFFAREIAFNDRISTYRIEPGEGKEADVNEYKAYFNALITKNIELLNQGFDVNFFDKIAFYTSDEPDTTSKWNTLKAENQAIQNAVNAVKYRLDNYPKLKASLEDWINLTPFGNEYTVKQVGTILPQYMRTPCPQFSDVESASMRNKFFETFNHVWWYGCINPHSPYPNYHADCAIKYSRVTSWMQYYYGFEGEVYWNICFSQRKERGKSDWVDIDVWSTDPRTWDNEAGDGRLVYPGVKYGIDGPITTQRMEQIRTSKQEYEYLLMLDRGIARLNERLGTNYSSARDILASSFNAMMNGTKVRSTFTTADMNCAHSFLVEYLNTLYN